MRPFVHKAALVMAATAVTSGLTGIGSTLAYADDSSIQANICNKSPNPLNGITVEGNNQDNQHVTWNAPGSLAPNECVMTSGWWWHKNTVLRINFEGGSVSLGVPDWNESVFNADVSSS
ncbi:hypothetical protein ABZZ74_53255 [Streptomyces sp. NPDC006476]|uniref:hypothetical protein n=1 Tax=Streptomyces sp. NPDC006476 TaxID=3157175 RepID=UPI0033BA9CAB